MAAKVSWVIGGDFNVTRYMEERKGGEGSSRDMTDFCQLINNLNLFEPPTKDRSFSWSNMRENPYLAKFDRFLVSLDWLETFPHTNAATLPKPTSDHSPIVLWSAEEVKAYQKIFKFEKMSVSSDEISSVVASNWMWRRFW